MKMKVLLTLILGFILYSCGCGGGSNKNSEQQTICGAYRVDLTVAQSGVMSTIIIKPDGSATMQQDGESIAYRSWSVYDNHSISIPLVDYQGCQYGTYIMDFSTNYLYESMNAYDSKNPNRRYKFIKVR